LQEYWARHRSANMKKKVGRKTSIRLNGGETNFAKPRDSPPIRGNKTQFREKVEGSKHRRTEMLRGIGVEKPMTVSGSPTRKDII